MTREQFATALARFDALDEALREARGARRPEYVRRLSALALLGAEGAPHALAAHTEAVSADLKGAPGVSSARGVFAAALVAAGRGAGDYRRAREALLPVLRGGLRTSLPAAALAYAAAGRTDLDADARARIAQIAEISRTPWWSRDHARNGFFAAALTLRDETSEAVGARLAAARQALSDAGARSHIARDGGRQLALAGAEPVAAARTWSTLMELRQGRRWPSVRPEMLIEAAAAAPNAENAAAALDAARDHIRPLRPGVSMLVRPHLTVSLAGQMLAPHASAASAAASAMQAVQAAIHAATVAAVAASGAAVAASG